MAGPNLPTNRTPANTNLQHAADHNTLHQIANLADLTTAPVLKGELVLNVKDYGASTGAADNTAFIQAAISAGSEVFVPPGTYNVLGTVEITNGKRLHLASGATLLKPSTAGNTDPVVWVKSSDCGIDGAAMRQSLIQSDCASPLGVVCVGYKGVSDAVAKNVLYTTVRGLSIVGKTNGGETSGSPSIALYLCNRSLSGLVSYFCNAQDLYLARANVGLWLHGYSNGHIINRLHLYHVGDEKQLDGAGIKLSALNGTEVPVDNSISQVFHHTSPNAVTLYFDGPVYYNNLTDIMAEQTGATAQFIKNNDDAAGGNNITGLDNVAGASNLTTNFLKKNLYARRDEVSGKKATFDTLIVTGTATLPPTTQLDVFAASGTWTKPTGAMSVCVVAIAGGAGGGSGRRDAAGTVRCGGGGGAGGAATIRTIPATNLSSTETVTVGTGGAGGAAITADATNGSNGGGGITTSFGTHVKAASGTGGGGGTNSGGSGGTGGAGAFGGGAGGAASGTGGAGSTPASGAGGSGGGSGGGISSADAASAGGTGGSCSSVNRSQSAGGAINTTATPAVDAPTGSGEPGHGGGGGGSSVSGAAGAGANGSLYGAGGGGGGASLNGNNSGKGGDGAAGVVIVVTTF